MRESWKYKKLKECGKAQTGTTPSTKEKDNYGDFIPFVKPANFQPNGEITYGESMLSEKGLKNGRYFDANSVLMVCIGATIGKTGFVTIPVSSNQQVNVLTPSKDCDYKFLYYGMISPAFQKDIIKQGKSSQATLPIINKSKWENLELPIPPLPEQKQIVSILDKAFAAIDQAKANIEQNIENAKELFQSKLNEIFSQNGEGWEEKKFNDTSLLEILDGDRGKNYPKKDDFFNEGHCVFMNTGNVRPDGFDFSTVVFITEERDNLLRKGKLIRDDVVMTTRGTIGNLGWYNSEIPFENIRINSGMLIFRVNKEKILPEFLFTLLRSSYIKRQIESKTSGAAQPQLPIKTIVTFDLPFNSCLEEQRSMVQLISKMESQQQKLLSVYLRKIENLEELKKSILQKAFVGELTEKEINLENIDMAAEPASQYQTKN